MIMQSSFKLNFCEGKTMIFEKSASNYQMDFVNFYFLNQKIVAQENGFFDKIEITYKSDKLNFDDLYFSIAYPLINYIRSSFTLFESMMIGDGFTVSDYKKLELPINNLSKFIVCIVSRIDRQTNKSRYFWLSADELSSYVELNNEQTTDFDFLINKSDAPYNIYEEISLHSKTISFVFTDLYGVNMLLKISCSLNS